ncbi:hypothetical protein MD484_g2494, partial [Candolleomyces efflorescens]
MPPTLDLSHHVLSESESLRIFTTQIIPADIPPTLTRRQGQPLAVLIAGQTGAGKTSVAPTILAAMNHVHPPTHLITDAYKSYHPAYLALLSSATPAHAAPATNPDARRWLAMAVAEAISRKLDVLLESACRHLDDFQELSRMFGEAGYRIDVVVLAVPAALSRLGILHRFYNRLPQPEGANLPRRFKPVKVHDASYQGLMNIVEWIDQVDFIDRVSVVRRGNMVAFSDEKIQGGKLKGKSAEALTKERNRPLPVEERNVALRDLEELEAHDAGRAEEILKLLEPLLKNETEGYPELHFVQWDFRSDPKVESTLSLYAKCIAFLRTAVRYWF